MSSKNSVRKSEKYVKEYAPLFGLSHYRYTVTMLPEDCKGKIWGRSHYNHQDEFFDVQVVPDGTLPEVAHRHLILHELAHGLLQVAAESDVGCEAVCNRVAKLVLGKDADSPNYCHNGGPNGEWPDMGEEENSVVNMVRRDLLGDDKKQVVVDKLLDSLGRLTERERYVLGSLFIDRMSFRAVARSMGVSARTVQRIRNSAVKKLSEVV